MVKIECYGAHYPFSIQEFIYFCHMTKMRHLKIYIFILFLSYTGILAGQTFSIEGKVYDRSTAKIIAGANIIVNGTKLGTVSDETGNYILKKQKGNMQLVVNFIGYEQIIEDVYIQSDTIINFFLNEAIISIAEVEVKGKKEDDNITKVETGIVELSSKEMESLPKFLGEADLIKTIKLTPGIQTSSEISSGLHVRGGGAGQNLIVLDDLPFFFPYLHYSCLLFLDFSD